ncbi:MAG TPA: CDC48 family AAA ATPase [Candidatus Bipolaricaulota bacterium]
MKRTTVELKASEAASEDVGRGIVRLDPKAMEELSIEAGDVVEVVGAGTALAKAMPTRPKDRDQGLIQLDGVLRANAKVKLGATVTVQPIHAEPAMQVVLQPLTQNARSASYNTIYLKKSLLNLPLKRGDQVRVHLFGAGFENFEVTHTQPQGAVLIAPETAIAVESPQSQRGEEAAASSPGITYEDIGGLKNQLDRIREMIELPLKYPQVFEQLGIDPPKGVLMYGPPGTGKTLIARALAAETDAYFISIAGPEVLSMFYGQSEANLRKVFTEAQRNQPAILFIDEIDALTPKRAEVSGEVEKRVVSQLLSLMDGLEQRQQVVVIGATNIPDSLDPALRRPGRFDREVMVPIPDAQGRLEILRIHTRGVPLGDEVDLEALAQRTHGFVGADLELLCREAAMKALRRLLPSLDLGAEGVPEQALLSLRVERDDFEEALNEIEPSAMREVFVEVPSVHWADVGGLEQVKQRLKQAIEWPLQHRELFDHFGIQPTSGILLHGPSGTGKTLLAQAVANECGVNFISIKGPEVLSRWVGDSEKRVRELFKHARRAAPCVLFIDEIDAMAAARGMSLAEVADRVTSQLLSELDGLEGLHGVTVIGATNRKDSLDPALLRPGRLELHLALDLPDDEDRQAILAVHTRRLPLASDVSVETLAQQTPGFSGAQLALVCREAALERMREYVEGRAQAPLEKLQLSQADFERAVARLRAQ